MFEVVNTAHHKTNWSVKSLILFYFNSDNTSFFGSWYLTNIYIYNYPKFYTLKSYLMDTWNKKFNLSNETPKGVVVANLINATWYVKETNCKKSLANGGSSNNVLSNTRLFNAHFAFGEQKAVGVPKLIMARKSSYSAKSLN